MSESDAFFKHQCFVPYLDTPYDIDNLKQSLPIRKSSRSVSTNSVISNRLKTSSLDVNLSAESVDTKSTTLQRYTTINDGNNSVSINVNDSRVTNENAVGKFLDLLSVCFWKCSLGCQELPTMK